MREFISGIAVLALMGVLAVPAMAQQQPAKDGYTKDGGQTLGQLEDEGGSGGNPDEGGNADDGGIAPNSASGGSDDVQPAATGSSGTGSLPFTGLDLALLAGAGLLLAGAGLGMRRLTRAPGTS